ncbi:hypothetical protein Glove_26g69 [Diversispora epigaea]|uniref:Uncharacterized protein n=1 Tax=Diversispora epigaea TaxID=1348612 RepID=A0A397JIK0_9GLOM|nr:hypothetical protein Glove_26g69 [Diversispora epigaea]
MNIPLQRPVEIVGIFIKNWDQAKLLNVLKMPFHVFFLDQYCSQLKFVHGKPCTTFWEVEINSNTNTLSESLRY